MIVVVTGTVGIDKKPYLRAVCELAQSRGRKIELCNIGDMMYAEAPDIAPGRILDIPLKRLHGLRRSVMKDILSRARGGADLIVNTHATFRWRHGLFPAFDFDQIRRLHPDLFICMVDSIEPLHIRLSRQHPMRHSLKDLLVWREEEILATEMMQRGSNDKAGFYILSRGCGEGTIEPFYRLLFEPWRKKAYLSFPMTHVMHLPEVIREIEDFRAKIKRFLICFDPGDLEEAYLPCYAQEAIAAGRPTIEVSALGQMVSFDAREVLSIEADINSQIYARDFALIDQSDMIVSFIPALPDGSAAVSSGVERELQHAHEAAKEVFVIWQAKRNPSVFVTQTATKVFRTLSEAIGYFDRRFPVPVEAGTSGESR
ncbi:MAG: AAA family ATPase [Phycisphaerae bacterium]|nr:AAA family ATPase [Phycisphaerae bacterium]